MNHNQSTYIRLTGSSNAPIIYDKDYEFDVEIEEKEHDICNYCNTDMLLNTNTSLLICSNCGIQEPIILDIDEDKCVKFAAQISQQYGVKSLGLNIDITSEHQVAESCKEILSNFGLLIRRE